MAKTLTGYQLLNNFAQRYNEFCNRIFGTTGDYMQNLKPTDLVEMKKVFSGVNGIVTMATEAAFILILEKCGIISCKQRERLVEHVRDTSPYTNGYDLRDDEAKIIAEVKCNFPVVKSKFGPAQIDALIKDIRGLQTPEIKTKEPKPLPEGVRRFLVLLCEAPDDTNFDKAVAGLISRAKDYAKIAVFDGSYTILKSDTIYIVKVAMSELDLSTLK